MLIGIYSKKLVFFLAVFGLVIGGVSLYKVLSSRRTVEADEIKADQVIASVVDNANISSYPGQYLLNINLLQDGSMVIGDKKIKEGIKPQGNYDELRYVVLDRPSEAYEKAEIVVQLPREIKRLAENPEIIAVHGARPEGAYLTGREIRFLANSVSPFSTVTIAARFPKGYFSLPISEEVYRGVNAVPGFAWLIGGLAFPLAAVGIILHMVSRTGFKRVKEVEGYVLSPPQNIPPAIVSILCLGRVGPRAIMATLIDLAQRGYIEIYSRGGDFVIYKNDVSPLLQTRLKPYEKILIEKMFLPRQKKVGSMDVEARAARHLFSRKVAVVYLGMYYEATSLGLFLDLPAKIHLRYRLTGIATFFLGLIGYIFFAVFSFEPKFVLLFWISLVLLGILIINLAPRLTIYSKRGESAFEDWQRFKNFLSQNGSFQGDLRDFERYLSYAIAMGCEREWAARFAETRFSSPIWYDSITRIEGVDTFIKTLIPVIDFIANSLNISSEPLVR